MSHLTSNLLGRCPLGRKICPYVDSYCSACITYEKTEQKKKSQNRKDRERRCGRMIHQIKIEKPYADAVLEGSKTFEIRYDDRGYQKGDVVEFNVIDNNDHEINHPLNDKKFEITYVLHGWGLKDSWCVFSIKEKKNE